jgi:hypothetical protein
MKKPLLCRLGLHKWQFLNATWRRNYFGGGADIGNRYVCTRFGCSKEKIL